MQRAEVQADEKIGLGYEETRNLLRLAFGWRPNILASALVKVLSPLSLPLEEGAFDGRKLRGNPHRRVLTPAAPLTVVAVHGGGWLRKVRIAARSAGGDFLNIVDVEGSTGRKAGAWPWAVLEPVEHAGHGRKGTGVRAKPGLLGSLRGFIFRGRGRGALCGRVVEKGSSESREEVRGQRGAANPDFLIHARGCPLKSLLEIQRLSECPVRIIPCVRTSTVPERACSRITLSVFLSRISPAGVIGRIASALNSLRTGGLDCGAPIYLDEFMRRCSDMELDRAAELLRIEILTAMVARHRVSSCPSIEDRAGVKAMVLSDPRLVSFMREHAVESGLSFTEVNSLAAGHLKEIASKYSPLVVDLFARAVDRLFDRFLDELIVDPGGIRLLERCDARKRIVLVCSHKSYVDPLLIGYAMYRSGLIPPYQAAGKNLSFFPVGWLLRHSGAFYIRRNFLGETLYKEVFEAYIRFLLARNRVMTLYIEGTRSRDGKISKPKLGFLKILSDAVRMNVCDDVLLLPVYLGYDKVPEENYHVRELAGERKFGESVSGFRAIYKSANTTLGRAFVRFGRPVSLKECVDSGTIEKAAVSACLEIEKVTPVTARAAVSVGLIERPGDWAEESRVIESASFILDYSRRKGATADESFHVPKALAWLENEGRIARDVSGGRSGFRMEKADRLHLFYNANIPIGQFLCEALLSTVAVLDFEAFSDVLFNTAPACQSIASLLTSRGGKGDGSVYCAYSGRNRGSPLGRFGFYADFLLELFAEEFVLAERSQLMKELERAEEMILSFARDARTAGGLENSLKRMAYLFSSLLRPFVEAYFIAAMAFLSLRDADWFSEDEYIRKCLALGEEMISRGFVRKVESCCKPAFLRAARCFSNSGLVKENYLRTSDEEQKKAMLSCSDAEETQAVLSQLKDIIGKYSEFDRELFGER